MCVCNMKEIAPWVSEICSRNQMRTEGRTAGLLKKTFGLHGLYKNMKALGVLNPFTATQQ